ncbi:hypothetical protein Aph01nite_48050 [Acrocarpospora phusangensis]|uniref:Uncharacterized protein n=1 Tax=Acrocarpospora phusangensis TaxID=1070424 RepID=A0A919USJ1_9ACTN|nr:hypothetical protein [Acrocarpospora phusangensis]GIH26495.1 hypothetical protein Aph01nite_48050 [Acrocarpospora phusangensis]
MVQNPVSRGPVVRFTRWLGLDRNPLRRRSDRVEGLIRLLSVFGLLASVVLGALFGVRTYREGLRLEAEQQRSRHPVDATLLETAGPKLTVASPAAGPVMAAWKGPNGIPHQGIIDAPALWHKGQTVHVWVDDRGEIVPRPRDRETTFISGMTVGVAIPVFTLAAVSLLLLTTRLLAVRRARNQWAAEWTAVEPTWRISG